MFEISAEEAVQRLGAKAEEIIKELTVEHVINFTPNKIQKYGTERFIERWYEIIEQRFHDIYYDGCLVEAEGCFAWSGLLKIVGSFYCLFFLKETLFRTLSAYIGLRRRVRTRY